MTGPRKQRVLIIAPAFYPYPRVASVRVTNWARLLPAQGYEPHIAVRYAGERISAERMATEVHPAVVVHPLAGHQAAAADASGSPGAIARAKLWAAHGVLTPDPSVLFWKRALPRIRALAREVAPVAVITTAPPHSIHIAGLALRAEGFPWIADYRDPHLLDDRFLPRGVFTPLRLLHDRFERRIYSRADAVTHAIELHQRWAQRRYPHAATRCIFLPHPCPEDLATGRIAPELAPEGRLSIRAVGHIGDAEALTVARAARDLLDRGIVDAEIRLAGKPPATEGEIRELLGNRAVIEGRVPHDRARALIAGADVLIAALAPDRSRTIGISSKLYEYIAARRPMLVINPTRPDRRLLSRIPGVRVLASPSQAEVSAAIASLAAERGGARNAGADRAVERYSLQQHARTLTDLLDRITSQPNHRPSPGAHPERSLP